jgi:hypothetical protein
MKDEKERITTRKMKILKWGVNHGEENKEKLR